MIKLSRRSSSQPLTPITYRVGRPPQGPRKPRRRGWWENATDIALYAIFGIFIFTGAIT